MLSKNKLRFIISLQKKKARDEESLFVIEGDKLVREFLGSEMKIMSLVAKPEFIGGFNEAELKKIDEIIPVSYDELKQVSTLKTPHNALAVVGMPHHEFRQSHIFKELCVALDFVQDPGNLGTIIRAAAWFGIRNIVCSENCVDVYNPKVIQATMGALLNVRVFYLNLQDFLISANEKKVPVFGTLLDGESIYGQELGKKGIILLGNESKGLSDDLLPYITSKLMIPKFTDAETGIESLNVGMAASIVFSEFARRNQ
jgi:RNA methyltransferase, TrmH family